MALAVVAELFYTLMRQTRWLASISCAISLSAWGCSASDLHPGANAAGAGSVAGAGNVAGSATTGGGANEAGAAGEAPSTASVAVVQVETVTTVQSSAGSFLSPTPEQLVPDYVERNPEGESAA
ncbi:MAG TPA: hypothetical protein VHM25_23705, partial [Polyangiaceae bacterium]|nr:hypothetical protein [Polyangiaceae bacterium]